MNRSNQRAWLNLSFAAAMLAAGCSAAPQSASSGSDAPAATGAKAAPSHEAAPDSLSPSSTDPRVQPVDAARLRSIVREPGAQVTLVNLWATWCAPCREEFPELVRLERAWRDRGVRVMFVSADFDDQLPAVRAFLSRHGVTALSWIKTGDDMAFINGMDPRWSGSLPATFIYDSRGELVRFFEGKADYAKFESELRTALERSPRPS